MGDAPSHINSSADRRSPLPQDLPLHTLPAGSLLYRIQPAAFSSPLFFGRGLHARFNDPLEDFGVCYASTSPEGAFVETLARAKLQHKSLSLSALNDQVLYCLSCHHDLSVVRLEGHYLLRLGIESSVVNAPDYPPSQDLARRLFDHNARPDALRYPARHNLSLRSLALFERASTHPQYWDFESRGTLLEDREFLGEMIELYELGLVA